MQMAALELTDLSKETAATKAFYGLEQPRTADFGGKSLLARSTDEIDCAQSIFRRTCAICTRVSWRWWVSITRS